MSVAACVGAIVAVDVTVGVVVGTSGVGVSDGVGCAVSVTGGVTDAVAVCVGDGGVGGVTVIVAVDVAVPGVTSVGNGDSVGVFDAVALGLGVRVGGTNCVGRSANVALGLAMLFTVTRITKVAVGRVGVGVVVSRGDIANAMAAMM